MYGQTPGMLRLHITNGYDSIHKGLVKHADTENPTTYSIAFPSKAGTVYGGTLTVNEDGTGKLVVTDANIASYSGETLPSTWISDRDVYAQGTTPTTVRKLCINLQNLLHTTFPGWKL